MQHQTQTRTVTEHTFVFTDDEFNRFLEDPWAFRDQMAAQAQPQKNGGVTR